MELTRVMGVFDKIDKTALFIDFSINISKRQKTAHFTINLSFRMDRGSIKSGHFTELLIIY